MGRLNIVKISVEFKAIPTKILTNNFVDIDRLILKFIRRDKRPRIASIILKEKKLKD